MPAGRPTTYKKKYCKDIVEYMSEGNSLTAFAAEIDTHKSVLYDWAKRNPEFADAIKKAQAKCQQYYEKLGQSAMAGHIDGFIPSMWIFNMKARFKDDWSERTEQRVEVTSSVDKLSDEELDERIEQAQRRIEERKDRQIKLVNPTDEE